MELHVTTDLTLINPQTIEFNKEELKAELAANLNKYKGLIVTEDTIPQAKAIRATVNKVATAINDEKKRIKKLMNEPVTRFESEVKELLSMCEEVSGAIDAQIKAFEDALKAAKKAALMNKFNAAVDSQFASFDEVFDPRWLNATFDTAEAEKIIAQFAERRAMDVAALNEIDAEPTVKAMLVSRFKQTKSLSEVLRLKKEIEQRAKYEAEQAAAREAEKEAQPVAPQPMPMYTPPPPVKPSQEIEHIKYAIYATGEKIAQLEAYMTAAGITFEEVF